MDISNIVKTLKESEVNAHFWHLHTDSYARHMALGIWYDEITDIIDSLVESWQGSYDTRLLFPSILQMTPYDQCESYFQELKETLATKIKECDNTCLDIQDILIEAKNLCNKICYLLTLK